jgi:hypothetical protein
MTQGARQQSDAAHEGSADAENMKVHKTTRC